ncbi:hypothetical protein ACWGB8_29140 [Kitasatospora sp. NPDC054939]
MRVPVPVPREPGWWRRLPAPALVWAAVAALVMVSVGLGAVPEARAATSVTVQGPKVWQPETQSYGPEGSVTVSAARNLTNQVVQVSWSGFTPSTLGGLPATSVTFRDSSVLYPVRIYQCRGTDPRITDCYGSTLYGGDPARGFGQKTPPAGITTPDFPSNAAIAVTGADGSGTASIEVWTAQQSPSLGCDAGHPCSLVVAPNYGGDILDIWQVREGAVDCTDHGSDTGEFFTPMAADAISAQAGSGVNQDFAVGEQCSWEQRTVVPLSFAPTPGECAAQNSAFSASGLEMVNRAVQQWRSGLCLAESPISFQYAFAGGEPQARAAFLNGSGVDVALTARPDREVPARPYVYAPLATSGISVVFVVDDTQTGRQIRDMRLNARLMAKLLTQSYAPTGTRQVPSVEGNPTCVTNDPEFLKLNPLPAASGLQWPASCNGGMDFLPTVVGSTTDLVHQLTSWIAADPDAARFLDGEPDPWGMHLNTAYLRPKFSGYPIEALQPQDFSGFPDGETETLRRWKQYDWNPVLGGLGQVSRKILENKGTCLSTEVNPTGGHDACAARAPGSRVLFAVMDSGQAKAYSLPEAELLNPAGSFAGPTGSGFQAAVAAMPVDPATGTQQLPYGAADTAFARDQRAYPLTTVQYAMVPTSGVPQAKAEAIARFLRTSTTGGQVYGPEPGRLAAGFLALTEAQRKQAAEAVKHVEGQDGKLPGNQTAPTAPADPSGGDGGDGGTAGGTTGGTTGPGGPAPVADGSGSSSGGTGSGSSSGGAGGPGGAAAAGGGTAGATGTGAAGAKPSATASPGPVGPLAAAPVAAGTPAADRAGKARLLLPVALIAGLVLLVGGPAALLLGGTPAGARAASALRTGWSRLRRSP